jgi:hypothetical protein
MFQQQSIYVVCIEFFSIIILLSFLCLHILTTNQIEYMSNMITHTNDTSTLVHPQNINQHQIINPPYNFKLSNIVNDRNKLNESESDMFTNSMNGNYSYIHSKHNQINLSNIISKEKSYNILSSTLGWDEIGSVDEHGVERKDSLTQEMTEKNKKYIDTNVDNIITEAEKINALQKINIQTLLK